MSALITESKDRATAKPKHESDCKSFGAIDLQRQPRPFSFMSLNERRQIGTTQFQHRLTEDCLFGGAVSPVIDPYAVNTW